MSDPLLVKGVEVALGAINDNQKGFIQYILVSRFGKTYKKYLKKNILIHTEAELEAKFEILDKYSHQDEDINTLSLIHEEAELEYRNMAGVLMKTIPKIENKIHDKGIDIDKIKRLKDLTKQFSADDMQELVSLIVAGEYNNPGAFSLHTISVINMLSQQEISLFQHYAGLIISGSFSLDCIYDMQSDNREFRSKMGFYYEDRIYLEQLGLVSSSQSETHLGIDNEVVFSNNLVIGGKRYLVEGKGIIKLSPIRFLTKAGKELFPFIKPIYNDNINQFIIDKLVKSGCSIKLIS